MASDYSITSTEPWTYLNELRNPVNGFRITVMLTKWNETHTLNVPTLDSVTIGKMAKQLADQREAIAKL